MKGLLKVGHCLCCGKKLSPQQIVWLECDNRDGTYHPGGTVPPEHSQGAFEFGRSCAKKIVKKEKNQ